jgi:hypothetical protein
VVNSGSGSGSGDSLCGNRDDDFENIKITIRNYFDHQLALERGNNITGQPSTYSTVWFATGGNIEFVPIGVLAITCEIPVCFVKTAIPLVKAYEQIERQLLLPQTCACFIYLPIRRTTTTCFNSINTATFTTQFLVATITSCASID